MTEKYCKLLGISVGAKPEEIKSQFRKLALKHHPDKGGLDKNFQLLTEAKDYLLKHGTTPSISSFESDLKERMKDFLKNWQQEMVEENIKSRIRIRLFLFFFSFILIGITLFNFTSMYKLGAVLYLTSFVGIYQTNRLVRNWKKNYKLYKFLKLIK